jgi:nitronate monooxygenase
MQERSGRFETELCGLLGIDYPVLQSGMGGVAGPELAAEVSNAGGLGILAATLTPPDRVRQSIHELRDRTDAPFGVNLLMMPELLEPVSTELLTEDELAAAHAALAPMRDALELPAKSSRPRTAPAVIDACLEVILDERVPVFSVGLGDPGRQVVDACHAVGTKVIAMVTSVADARAVAASGVDAIVAQGLEAGGHRSHFRKPGVGVAADVGTLALVPEVVDAVNVPVVAAGGIVDGRGLVAALALGASGVLLGSRFLVTRESTAPESHKKALLERTGAETVVTDLWSGRYARVLRNGYLEQYEASGAPPLPFPTQMLANADVRATAEQRDEADYLPLWGGQAVGQIQDLPWAGDVVRDLVDEARRLLSSGLGGRVHFEPA